MAEVDKDEIEVHEEEVVQNDVLELRVPGVAGRESAG